ncbi:TPA: hypothetical protein ACG671_000917 [Streptococcus agalactiae]|uniref:hypothetical protein n=1 Tax=Streptococcus agalactiae TaxID=1311 RepID=UPI0005E2FF26|nr:hypothetical protein [Streptococcus agalactiae]OCM86273.1 hypothetical protein AX251_11045 [Streptococcus agalactiae]CNH11717.1 phage protein [Streptococcus agalactiae]HEN3204302.1 hypothetical protein [Streptococcus agalactiae]HEN9382884.1 hypothetical protein [Streptococcus agalactiae]HEN9993190.1 hypothetical protein [Streptococcus agalactiae]
MEQINITGTEMVVISDIALETFVIAGHLSERWEFVSEFKKIDDGPSLDENGELFEPAYELVLEAKTKTQISVTSSYFAKEHKKDTDEIIKVFSFIEDNKRNFFETLGIRGVLE